MDTEDPAAVSAENLTQRAQLFVPEDLKEQAGCHPRPLLGRYWTAGSFQNVNKCKHFHGHPRQLLARYCPDSNFKNVGKCWLFRSHPRRLHAPWR